MACLALNSSNLRFLLSSRDSLKSSMTAAYLIGFLTAMKSSSSGCYCYGVSTAPKDSLSHLKRSLGWKSVALGSGGVGSSLL